MRLSPWSGDYTLILHFGNTGRDFGLGCSERIKLKRNHEFGPPQHYQITADTSPSTPGFLAQITSWGEEGRPLLKSVCVCCPCMFVWEVKKKDKIVLQLSMNRDTFSPSQGCCTLVGETRRTQCLCGVLRGPSDSCVQSARGKLMGENDMSTRGGWGQYRTKIMAAATHSCTVWYDMNTQEVNSEMMTSQWNETRRCKKWLK